MVWLIVVSLILAGIVFLLLEILVVPGATLVGLLGVALVVAGNVISFNNYGTETGVITILLTLVVSMVSIGIALRSRTWKRAMHSSALEGRVNVIEADKVLKGDEGISITRLNPMGKALIKEDYYEVSSKDNLIPENTPIEVVKVEGNKIIVKSKEE